jgi:dihydropteroate synthase
MRFNFNHLLEPDSIAVMGVLNLSPNSFYSKNYFSRIDDALIYAEKLIEEGAHILDIGAESTRPGSKKISVNLELERLIPIISKLAKKYKIPISIDTYKPEVASAVLQEGANVINDISGLSSGSVMAKIVSRHNAGIVLMHMKGTPETMQENPYYDNVCSEVFKFLRQRIELAEDAGIDSKSIAIDPGIGFGKNLNHNLTLISNLDKFKVLDKAILLGVSRKSFIGDVLCLGPEDRLEGSIAAGVIGFIKGANILRVHDVGATVRAVKLANAIKKVKLID